MLQRAQGGLYRAVVHDVRDGRPVRRGAVCGPLSRKHRNYAQWGNTVWVLS